MRLAIKALEKANGLNPVDLGNEGSFMGAVKNFSKGYPTVTHALFAKDRPEPAEYVAIGRKAFSSPFFEALNSFCRVEQGAEHFIHQVLGLPLADVKALSGEFRK
jgi:hypothetical protein